MEIYDTDKALRARFDAEEAAKKKALLDKIELIKTRMTNKDKAIEELKYERDLIFGDLRSVISNDLCRSSFNLFMGYNSDMLWKAWRWSSRKSIVDEELKNGDITNDEYHQHEFCFDFTTNTVRRKFFGEFTDEVEFKEIIMAWTIGYDFVYRYKDQEITIFIPVFHADEKDWEYALIGYRAKYRESEYVDEGICSGLEYKEVAAKLQDWMRNEGWKKENNPE